MRSRQYFKRISPVRKFVSNDNRIRIVHGKPQYNWRGEPERKKVNVGEIKYTRIIANGAVDNMSALETVGIDSTQQIKKVLLSKEDIRYTVFLIVKANGEKEKYAVGTGSRNYYYLMQFLKK